MALPYPERLIVFSAFLLYAGFARAQGGLPADTLVKRIQQYNRHYVKEKVHLHFDKPYYALGDTVWFESYIVNALNNIPADRSRILHVELIGPANTVIKALQLPVSVGFAAGDFTLADSLAAGNYHIRAYTHLMRNFGDDYFFNKSITVIDPFPKTAVPAAPQKPAAATTPATAARVLSDDIRFFPEGGQLVAGLQSTVGFKAVAPNGLGIAVSGTLVDEQGNKVLSFKTAYAGMGAFSFIPRTGKTYSAMMQLANGQTRRIALPAAAASGYVLSADNSRPDSLYITLQATADLVNKGQLTFMPLANGTPLFFMNTQFPDGHISITAPKDKLPGGIIRLALLNAQNQPVAERLVFNNYRQQIHMDIDNLKAVYTKRERAEYAMLALDAAGKPAIGSFSVSVTNADAVAVDEQAETTIFSNLLLSSELKGYIETPNYYFTDTSAAKNAALDHLMLTQGWRNFVWQDVATAQLPALAYPAEEQISVSGKLNSKGKDDIKGIPVTLLAGELGAGLLLDTVTNARGQFKFYVADSLRNLPIRVQAKPKNGATYNLLLDGYTWPSINNNMADTIIDVAGDSGMVNNNKVLTGYSTAAAGYRNAMGKGPGYGKTIPLREVVIKDFDPTHKLRGTHSTSANLNGPGQANFVITGKEIENCPDLSCITAMIPGVWMSNKGGLVTFMVMGNIHQPPALILVDGVDGDINTVTPSNVESIEFMRTPDYAGTYGIRGAGGVLLITTKKGGLDYNRLTAKAPNSISFKLPLYLKKEFYSPQYDHPEKTPDRADLRTTVYWKPDVVTGKDGRAPVCFYNTDVAGNYRVVIEGISSKGYLCRQVYSYKVE